MKKMRAYKLLLVIGIAALTLGGHSLAAAATGPIPATFFGLHFAGAKISPPATPVYSPIVLGALGKCPATNWTYIESQPGQYDWKIMDYCTQLASQDGVKYFQGWQYMTPTSIGATDPANDPRCWAGAVKGVYLCMGTMTAEGEQQWTNFNAAMAKRYGDTASHPGMDFYEGWNEPPYPPKKGVSPITAAELAQYERDRVTAIRANDPNAKVASPAFVIDPQYPSYAKFADNFLGDNPPAYDYYDFHMDYSNAPEDEIPLIAQYRRILSDHGITNPTILATESGRGGSGADASANTCPAWPSNVNEPTQQGFIARMELIYWSQGIDRHYWYSYGTCGDLLNSDHTGLNADGIAYGNVENWMIGATMSSPCAQSSEGIWTCMLTRPGDYQALVMWDASQTCSSDNCATAVRDIGAQYNQYRDLSGAVHVIQNGSVPVGAQPIIVENVGAPQGPPPPPPPDLAPPTINIDTPRFGQIVSGAIGVTTSATDNVGVIKVELYVDGMLASTSTNTTSPYAFPLNADTLPAGVHFLSAKAYDAAGNIGISPWIFIIVPFASHPAPIRPPIRMPLPTPRPIQSSGSPL